MKYYCIKSKKSEKYIAGNNPNTFHLTAQKSNALTYEDQSKVKNIIKSLPKRLDPFGPFETHMFVVEEEDSAETDVDLQKIKTEINEFSSKIKEVLDNKSNLSKQLSDIDSELSDIVHYIENYKFSASEGYKLAKMIQDKRKERRVIKNKLRIIDTIKTESCTGLSNGRLIEKLDKIEQQKYAPRVLIDLFESKIK